MRIAMLGLIAVLASPVALGEPRAKIEVIHMASIDVNPKILKVKELESRSKSDGSRKSYLIGSGKGLGRVDIRLGEGDAKVAEVYSSEVNGRVVWKLRNIGRSPISVFEEHEFQHDVDRYKTTLIKSYHIYKVGPSTYIRLKIK